MSSSQSSTKVHRRLVICVDGTWCTPDGATIPPTPNGNLTTVYNLFACVQEGVVVDGDGKKWEQMRHYEPGLGAIEEPGLRKLMNGASGAGYQDLIRDTYKLACTLDKDDELWFFGFSRGAYIVRAVASLLLYIRKLKTWSPKSYNEPLRVYKEKSKKGSLGKGQINLFFKAETVPPPNIKFMGVFDTVKAVEDHDLFDMSLHPDVRHTRHALAIHENRKQFSPELYAPDGNLLAQIHKAGHSFVQAWFAGAHIDIGGSAEAGGLALYPLQWMLIECRDLGLKLEFHGNSEKGPKIDNPLDVVFPQNERDGMGMDIWTCTTGNQIPVAMQDLRAVHNLTQRYGTRYQVKVNRDSRWFWGAQQHRPLFEARNIGSEAPTDSEGKSQSLIGYCGQFPLGTIIHPSMYCLMDSDVNVIMDSRQGDLLQDIAEWSDRMLGESKLTINGITEKVPNPGFWGSENLDMLDELPALRILICGYTGVGKSTLVSKVFGGIDRDGISHRKRGKHSVRDEIRFEGRGDIVIHDSNGFEGGSEVELQDIQEIFKERVDEDDLKKQLHVIWFCVEADSSRIVQSATEKLFDAMDTCRRHVPVVVVATKKDKFLSAHAGSLMRQGHTDYQQCLGIAEKELALTAAEIEAEIAGIKGGRVDALVCVDQDDKASIDDLTKTSADVSRDQKIRLMYVKAQTALPALKIKLAMSEVTRQYKHVVRCAAGTAFIPWGPTGTRQGAKDDICKKIIKCFGVPGLNNTRALRIMQSYIKDGVIEGLSMFWTEALAGAGVTSLLFLLTAPLVTVSWVTAASIITPLTAQLYLLTACDLILILARSFQIASFHKRAKPVIADVEAAAEYFSKYAEHIHQSIQTLVPRSNPFRCFSYNKIQPGFQRIIESNWQSMSVDVAHQEAEVRKDLRAVSSSLELPRESMTSSRSDVSSKSSERRRSSSKWTSLSSWRWSSSALKKDAESGRKFTDPERDDTDAGAKDTRPGR